MKRAAMGLLLIAGCSDVGETGGVDAAPGIDAVPRSCTVAPDLGALGARDGTPMASGSGATRRVSVSMVVASDAATRDAVFVQLFGGRGVFAGGAPVPGTYPLTGAELGFETCGVCVTVIGDIVTGQGPTQFYMARSGTVTITQATASLTGSLSAMTFGELDINDGMVIRDGCETQHGGLTFDEVLP